MASGSKFEHQTSEQARAIGESVSRAAGETREHMREALEHGRESGRRAYGRASEVAHHLRDRGAERYRAARSQVQRHALASTLIAFVTGFLVARFLFRR